MLSPGAVVSAVSLRPEIRGPVSVRSGWFCSDPGHAGSSVCSAVRGKLPANVHSYPVGHINNLCRGSFFLLLSRAEKG